MATLAALLKHKGHDVRGSDQNIYPPMSTFLAAEGIETLPGYRAEHITPDLDLVVVGNAVSRGNPEVEAVLDRKIRHCSLPEAVREHFLWGARSIVIAGTHGKTTTTALAAWLLTTAGRDPSLLVGGIAANFGEDGSSYRLGSGRDFVIEGDEYDSAFFDKTAKFLKYLPDIAVIGNIEFDHADIYANLDEIRLAFRRLVNLVPGRGLLLLGARQPGGRRDEGPRPVAGRDVRPVDRRRLARLRPPRHGAWRTSFGVRHARKGPGPVRRPAARRPQRAQRAGGDRRGARGRRRPQTIAGGPRAVRRGEAPAGGAGQGGRRHRVRRFRASSDRHRRDARGPARRASRIADSRGLRAAFRLVLPAACSRRRSPTRSARPTTSSSRPCSGRTSRRTSGCRPSSWSPTSARRGTPARYVPAWTRSSTLLVGERRAGDQVVIMSNGGFGGIHGKLMDALLRGGPGTEIWS